MSVCRHFSATLLCYFVDGSSKSVLVEFYYFSILTEKASSLQTSRSDL